MDTRDEITTIESSLRARLAGTSLRADVQEVDNWYRVLIWDYTALRYLTHATWPMGLTLCKYIDLSQELLEKARRRYEAAGIPAR
jgi:hypothetical protein